MQLCLIIKERWLIPRRNPCNAHSIRRFALPAEGKVPYRGHAGDVPRNRTLDHSKRLAQESKAPYACAAREAREEAGVIGKVGRSSIGSYSYQKRLKRGKVVVCQVDVFPLEVKRLEKSWPEKGEREIQWFSPKAAAETVSEPVLSDIIRNLPKRL